MISKELSTVAGVPELVSVRDIKNQYNNRSELRRKLKELKRYSIRGMERTVKLDNLELSQYELTNLKIERRRAKIRIARKIKLLDTIPKEFGKDLSQFTYKQMGSDEYVKLKETRDKLEQDIKSFDIMDLRHLENLIKNINKPSRNREFRQNYFEMLRETAYEVGYDDAKINEIISKINTLTDKKFIELITTDKGIQQIMYAYKDTKNPRILQENYQAIYDTLDNLYENITDVTGYYLE